jgi:uncharacterized protein YjgD (DUF1641 family)
VELKMDKDLALLHEKIDHLTEQLESQQRRQRELSELTQDLIPVANHMIKLSIDELAEIGQDFQLEDLFFLLKRLLRNTHSLMALLDRLESLTGLIDDVNWMSKEAFNTSIETLDRFEQQGYFAFLQESWHTFESVVQEFDEKDFETLRDNMPTILSLTKKISQSDILSLAENAVDAFAYEGLEKPPSMFALLRELMNPQVRRGLAHTIQLVKTLGAQSQSNPIN